MRFSASKISKYTVLLALPLIIAIILFISNYMTKTPVPAGSIIILPVKISSSRLRSLSPDKSLDSYPMMDTLIGLLQASAQYPLLQTEDVIDILHRASSPTLEQAPWDINRLFSVSGASLILELSIADDVDAYRLSYSLHQKESLTQGIIIDTTLPQVINTFTKLLNQRLGLQQKVSPKARISDFTRPELITAIKYIQDLRLEDAQRILTSLVSEDANNLIANRLLLEVQFKTHEFIAAKHGLASAIDIARHQESPRELSKLGVLSAQIDAALGDLEPALLTLSKAKLDAASVNDWQSLGRISQLSGQINQRLGRHLEARNQFLSGLSYFKIIHCPYGRVQTLNDIANIEFVEHNYGKAYRYINQSLEIVTKRKLLALEAPTFNLLAKIEAKLQR